MTPKQILDSFSETLMRDERILSAQERALVSTLLQHAKAATSRKSGDAGSGPRGHCVGNVEKPLRNALSQCLAEASSSASWRAAHSATGSRAHRGADLHAVPSAWQPAAARTPVPPQGTATTAVRWPASNRQSPLSPPRKSRNRRERRCETPRWFHLRRSRNRPGPLYGAPREPHPPTASPVPRSSRKRVQPWPIARPFAGAMCGSG